MTNKYIERGYNLEQLEIFEEDLLEELGVLVMLVVGAGDFQKESEIIKRKGEDYFDQVERRYAELDLIDDAKQALK